MGTISSGIGLISGLATADLVDLLIAIQSRPRILLQNRRATFQAKRLALLDISAKLVALQISADTFSDADLFKARTATSSNESILKATVQAGANLGSFQFQPVSLVQTHQLISSGFSASDSPVLGTGTLRISGGGFVDSPTSLDLLNGTAGVQRGIIRITDRSGVSADIDLTTALDVNDVLDAINLNSTIRVKATVSGDSLVLTDETGQTASNLIVEDLSGGTTSADLGIKANVAANTITGSDLIQLSGGMSLSLLNDAGGVRKAEFVNDLRITLKDSTTIDVNLDTAVDLGDVIDLINNDSENTGNLTASISADGVSLTLTDTSGGGGTLTVTALNSSNAAEDLGILGTEQGSGVLQGTRLIAGLNTVLLKSLNGGAGISDLGSITITDRLGTLDTIDLSAAETLQDVVDAINGATPQVSATINAARNGIVITDTSGGGGNLTIADVASSTVAADLGIAIDAAVSFVESGDRNRQYINENTLLGSFGDSDGVSLGKFQITDSAGATATIDLELLSAKTLGDVINAINGSAIGVTASINGTGDGLLLTDTAGGGGTLTVQEVDNGSTAADLHILGSATASTIDGSLEVVLSISSSDTLEDLVANINTSGAGVTAVILNDGSGVNPYRLTLISQQSGRAGELLVDTLDAGFTVSTTVRPEDAVLLFGSGVPGTEPLLLRSTDNSFDEVLPGLTIDMLATTNQPITVSVTKNQQAVVDAVNAFVSDFNNLVARIDALRDFDTETEARSILQGDLTLLQVNRRLNDFALGTFSGVTTNVKSLVQLGIQTDGLGNLVFDETVLLERLDSDFEDVRDFFLTTSDGLGDRLDGLIDFFTDSVDGLITRRTEALDRNVDDLDSRIEDWQERLDIRRQRLLNRFANLEETLALLQTQLDALNRFQTIKPLSFRRGS